MAWLYAASASMVVWALCGAVMGLGRQLGTLRTALLVHLATAPIFSFIASAIHELWYPSFDPLTRAGIVVGVVIALDAAVVAPLLERSYAMFRSVLGTWLPFLLIFAASWLAGVII